MNRFERPGQPSPEVAKAEKSRNTLQKLLEKNPRLRSFILAASAAAAMFGSTENANASQNTPEKDTATENKAESGAEIKDKKFVAAMDKVKQALDDADVTPPSQAVFTRFWKTQEVNFEESNDGCSTGELPRSAENVVISTRSADGSSSRTALDMNNKLQNNEYRESRHSFAIEDADTDPTEFGERFTVSGVGQTEDQAIQFALEDAVAKLGKDITTQNFSDRETDNKTISDVSVISGKHRVSYTVTSLKQERRGEPVTVTVEVTPISQ